MNKFSDKIKKQTGEDLIRQEIGSKGPMGFMSFVDLALYHPVYGYYNRSQSPRGRGGDYFTSLQVSDLFPKIICGAILQMKEELNTEQFHIIELGSGHGEFLEGVLNELSARKKIKGIHVYAVEKSRSARDVLWRRLSRFPKCHVLSSVDDIDRVGSLEGCLFSNELFDALPFQRLKRKGNQWVEIKVDMSGASLVETEFPIEAEPASLAGLAFKEGQEIEYRPQIDEIFDAWSLLLSRGYILTFDYGYPRQILYDPIREKGTWLCYDQHKTNQKILTNIGRQDITAHIDFTQLAAAGERAGFEAAVFCSQGQFLTQAGVDVIEDYLKNLNEEDKRRKIGALQQLIHPQSMGEKFWALLHQRDVALPPFAKNIHNRLSRLKV